jgi:hypothetical protein
LAIFASFFAIPSCGRTRRRARGRACGNYNYKATLQTHFVRLLRKDNRHPYLYLYSPPSTETEREIPPRFARCYLSFN